MTTFRKILIAFCLASAGICMLGGDPWAAAFCAMNAGWLAG